MTDYHSPRPSPTTPYNDPCASYDNTVSLGKVINGDSTVTTYTGKQILSLSQAIDKFGFGVAPFTFTQGGILQSKNLLVSNDPVDSFLYKYIGTEPFPLTIAPVTDPTMGVDWQQFAATDHNLLSNRNAAGAHEDSAIGIGNGRSQQNKNAENPCTIDFGVVGDGIEDDTSALTLFLNACVIAGFGYGITGAIYKVTAPIVIDVQAGKSVYVDFRGSQIKYVTPLSANDYIKVLTFQSSTDESDSSVFIDRFAIDCDVPYFETVTGADRRGIGGLNFYRVSHISVSNHKAKNMFYSAGISAQRFKSFIIENVDMIDVGSKFKPEVDDIGTFDAAGDAIYLNDAVGDAKTIINNLTSKSYAGKIGRAGIVCEELTTGITSSHTVSITNTRLIGYQRTTHQEDAGKSVIIWNGGETSGFSCCNFNLHGLEGVTHVKMNLVSINVNPPFPYGGVSGLQNFQAAGKTVYDECTITYQNDVSDKGQYDVVGGYVSLNSQTLTSNAVGDISYNGVDFTTPGTIYVFSGELLMSELTIPEGSIISVNGGGSSAIFSKIKSDGANFIATNVRDKKIVFEDSDIRIKSGDTLLSSSANSVVVFSGGEIYSEVTTDLANIYGDGAVDSSYYNVTFKNVSPSFINGGGEPDGSDVSRVVGCTLTATGTVPPKPFINTFAPACVIQSTTFIDKTVSQGMTVPPNAGGLITTGVGNVLVKSAGYSPIV